MRSLGIYIHIPFCIKKCLYCDFCSFCNGSDYMEAYCEELCRRIKERAEDCGEYTVDTVYIGGGTPTLLPIEQLARIMRCVRDNYRIDENCEISCECNPATADKEYFHAMRNMGINRLSIGAQSADDGELNSLGRAHDFADFVSAFKNAREAGFENISVDLMYGIPEQTVESFKNSIERICSLSPEHISSYCLKIEEGTPFSKMKDRLSLPDDDTEYEMYELLTNELEKNGYHKYEISNFARDGLFSRHNTRYWKGREYLGFGVAAHSYFNGERYGNSRDMTGFLSGKDICEERRRLTEKEKNDEYVMLGLRLCEGIELSELKRRSPSGFDKKYAFVKKMIDVGFMRELDGRISFTDKGFFVSNYILTELLDFE